MSHPLPAGSRIGLICEGAPDLLVVADFITRLLRPDLSLDTGGDAARRDRSGISPIGMTGGDCRRLAPKPQLLRQAPAVAASLLEDGCAHVVILWDSAPYGKQQKNNPAEEVAQFWRECDLFDAEEVKAGRARLDRAALCPVPIVRELESWLLADERALSSYLSTPGHKVSIGRIKKPELETNPKMRLTQIFTVEGRRGVYQDYVDAPLLAREVPDTARLRRLPSFKALMANVDATT